MRTDVDHVAKMLAHLGRMARSMPPSWDGGRVTIPCHAPNATKPFGRVLPGRGLLLAGDLKAIGLRGDIPHVYERSQVARLAEAFAWTSRMVGLPPVTDPWWQVIPTLAGGGRKLVCPDRLAMRLAQRVPLSPSVQAAKRLAATITLDAILDARPAKAFDRVIAKLSQTTVANTWSALFRSGGIPVAGTYTAITGGAAHTRASTGAWSHALTDPSGSDIQLLLGMGFSATSAINFLMLVDLLVAASNIDANNAAAQTVNTTALTRYTTGEGVMMTFDITTALGATASNLVVTYTDQGGTGGATTPAIAMLQSGITFRLTPVALGPMMELASGDYGVRSVETFDLSAAMGGGLVAVNLYFPLMIVPGVAANIWAGMDAVATIDRMVRIQEDGSGVLGCLTGYIFANTTSSGVLTMGLNTAQLPP